MNTAERAKKRGCATLNRCFFRPTASFSPTSTTEMITLRFSLLSSLRFGGMPEEHNHIIFISFFPTFPKVPGDTRAELSCSVYLPTLAPFVVARSSSFQNSGRAVWTNMPPSCAVEGREKKGKRGVAEGVTVKRTGGGSVTRVKAPPACFHRHAGRVAR